MIKNEIILLHKGLDAVSNLVGQKFGYAIARNIQLLNPVIEKIEEERKALVENYAKKVDGKKVIEGDKYIFDDKEAFDAEFQKLLKEEVEVKLFYIKLDEVPQQITAGQINGIYPIIQE